MRNIGTKRVVGALAIAAALASGTLTPAFARGERSEDGARTMTVTVESKGGAPVALAKGDFALFRGETRQEVLDVKTSSEAPINVAVLIQDGLDQGVGHELETIKRFIGSLPEGSRVMVGYLRGTHLQVASDFTTDRAKAASAIRVPVMAMTVGSAPFDNLREAIRRFDELEGRNQIVMVSNGLELNRGLSSAAPSRNMELDRAILAAQKRGIPVWAIYANAPGAFGHSNIAVTYGQGSLSRLAEETGGRAFFGGRGFVTFDHALREVAREMSNQYLVAYRSTGRGELEVSVEAAGVKVRHSER